MRTATLTRRPSTDEGTPGDLVTDQGFRCVTLELPDWNNIPGKSCVLRDSYVVRMRWSEKHQRNVYGLEDKNGRTYIEIHSYNLAGNADLGLVAQALGCIGLGSAFATFPAGIAPAGNKPQMGITNSAMTVEAFEKHMAGADFVLTIA